MVCASSRVASAEWMGKSAAQRTHWLQTGIHVRTQVAYHHEDEVIVNQRKGCVDGMPSLDVQPAGGNTQTKQAQQKGCVHYDPSALFFPEHCNSLLAHARLSCKSLRRSFCLASLDRATLAAQAASYAWGRMRSCATDHEKQPASWDAHSSVFACGLGKAHVAG